MGKVGRPAVPLEERFWEHVGKGKDGECWRWYGYHYLSYPLIHLSNTGQRRASAAKVSWILAGGPDPGRLKIKHRCRNRECVNPEHLYIAPRPIRKQFTPEIVRSIRQRAEAGESQASLAREFSVWPVTIWKLVNHLTWRDL